MSQQMRLVWHTIWSICSSRVPTVSAHWIGRKRNLSMSKSLPCTTPSHSLPMRKHVRRCNCASTRCQSKQHNTQPLMSFPTWFRVSVARGWMPSPHTMWPATWTLSLLTRWSVGSRCMLTAWPTLCSAVSKPSWKTCLRSTICTSTTILLTHATSSSANSMRDMPTHVISLVMQRIWRTLNSANLSISTTHGMCLIIWHLSWLATSILKQPNHWLRRPSANCKRVHYQSARSILLPLSRKTSATVRSSAICQSCISHTMVYQ